MGIVCDRYAYSGVAFTAAKGFAIDWCKAPDAGLPKPDAVIYLKMPVDAAMTRGGAGDERYEKAEFQKVVKGLFENELYDRDTWRTVDAAQSIEQVSEAINAIVDPLLESATAAPIGTIFDEEAHAQKKAKQK